MNPRHYAWVRVLGALNLGGDKEAARKAAEACGFGSQSDDLYREAQQHRAAMEFESRMLRDGLYVKVSEAHVRLLRSVRFTWSATTDGWAVRSVNHKRPYGEDPVPSILDALDDPLDGDRDSDEFWDRAEGITPDLQRLHCEVMALLEVAIQRPVKAGEVWRKGPSPGGWMLVDGDRRTPLSDLVKSDG